MQTMDLGLNKGGDSTMKKAIVLTDGEHYPSVTHDAISELREQFLVQAAVFIGGTEKVGSDSDLDVLGVPIVRDSDYLKAVERAIDAYRPDEVIDLSDEPVVGYRERFRIASFVLSKGVAYRGADFLFTPPLQETGVSRPSLSVIGTGKRIGKTAIGGFVARTLAEKYTPLVVTMGRGGPPEPELLLASEIEVTPEYLLSISRKGRHASSDHFEDLLTSRVTTIGCRRCGGGMSGHTFFSNMSRGAELSENIEADVVIFEGSGSSLPPVRTDSRILVIGAHQPIEYLHSYLGPYRILVSDLVILTMCEPPMADEAKVKAMEEAIRAINPRCRVVKTVFRPRPIGNIQGKRIALTVTAPAMMTDTLSTYLEKTHGCKVVGVSPYLSNRPKLRSDLEEFEAAKPDVILSELKAAAVDVVTAWSVEKGFDVVFIDNEPISIDPDVSLQDEILQLIERIKPDQLVV
jgi:cyclic 2,3-diphosphoglycerate synthetase